MLTDEEILSTIASVCDFDRAGVERWRTEALIIGRAVALAALAAPPVEFQDVERVLTNGDGQWKPCTGCYDTEDGHPTQKYPQSAFLKCPTGHGCSECGGLGAVWDDYSMYEDVYDASSVASKEGE